MTHTASHIILSAIKTPITANGKWCVWHALLAFLLAGFVAGFVTHALAF